MATSEQDDTTNALWCDGYYDGYAAGLAGRSAQTYQTIRQDYDRGWREGNAYGLLDGGLIDRQQFRALATGWAS